MDWVQRPIKGSAPDSEFIVFQSLLSWIGFKDQFKGTPDFIFHICFNPCCRGLGSKTAHFRSDCHFLAVVSILVVVDWVQRLNHIEILHHRYRMFQSLLSWIGFKDTRSACARSGRSQVSILVVVDWVQRHGIGSRCCIRDTWVSILVVVDWVQRPRNRLHQAREAFGVSILVVVDWVQRPDIEASQHIGELDVSILVVVDWVQRPATAKVRGRLSGEFQSLLSWIGFKDFHADWRGIRPESVSILVVVDWVQRRREDMRFVELAGSVSILVVVDWVQRLNARCIESSRIPEFQSLLSWIGFKDGLSNRLTFACANVSILVVVDWVQRLRSQNHIPASIWSFNPCCRGLGSKTSPPLPAPLTPCSVSILVVVDWVQRLQDETRRLGFMFSVSILVVVDWVQRRHSAGAGVTQLSPVSILVVVDWVQRLVVKTDASDRIKVSILVVVDWVQRRRRIPAGSTVHHVFQSLLSWIGFKDVPIAARNDRWHGVSILVVVDWVQRPGVSPCGQWSLLRGFNPCCRGLGSKTAYGEISSSGNGMFQSLLSWIGFKDSKLHVYANRIEVYVKFTRHVFFDEGAVLAC